MKNNPLRIKTLACLSYLGPLCFVPLMNRDSEFVHLHAKQGLVLWALSNLLVVLFFIPAIGMLLVKILTIFIFIISLMGIISVLTNKAYKLPLITDLSLAI